MRDLNAEGAPERSGVNGLCVECFEREEERTEIEADAARAKGDKA